MNTKTCNETTIILHRARMQMDANDHTNRLRIQRIMHYVGQQLGRNLRDTAIIRAFPCSACQDKGNCSVCRTL